MSSKEFKKNSELVEIVMNEIMIYQTMRALNLSREEAIEEISKYNFFHSSEKYLSLLTSSYNSRLSTDCNV